MERRLRASSFCEKTRRTILECAPSSLPAPAACYGAVRLAREHGVYSVVEVTLDGVSYAATSVEDLTSLCTRATAFLTSLPT